jgi:soluble lytic murein transglycosylase-like protein
MQVMGGKARELGFQGTLTELTQPMILVEYGCIFVKKLQDKYNSNEYVAAAYNAGTPLIDPVTKHFKNQEYVDKVMSNYGG